jgi:hypothetical protein
MKEVKEKELHSTKKTKKVMLRSVDTLLMSSLCIAMSIHWGVLGCVIGGSLFGIWLNK